MKKWILGILGFILLLILSIFTGYILANREEPPKKSIVAIQNAKNTNSQNNAIIIEMENVSTVSSIQEKISPTTEIIKQTYYNSCKHINNEEIETKDLINKTQEEIEKIYNNYEIKQFDAKKVVLYKEEAGICDEHYVLKEKDGYLAIYKMNNNNQEKLQELTRSFTRIFTRNRQAKYKKRNKSSWRGKSK